MQNESKHTNILHSHIPPACRLLILNALRRFTEGDGVHHATRLDLTEFQSFSITTESHLGVGGVVIEATVYLLLGLWLFPDARQRSREGCAQPDETLEKSR